MQKSTGSPIVGWWVNFSKEESVAAVFVPFSGEDKDSTETAPEIRISLFNDKKDAFKEKTIKRGGNAQRTVSPPSKQAPSQVKSR